MKTARARIAAVEAERDTANARAERSAAALRRFRVDSPLEEIAAGLVDLPPRYAVALIRDHFEFDLGEEGDVTARTKAEPRTVPFTREGIAGAARSIPELCGRFHKPVGPAATGGAKREAPSPGNAPNRKALPSRLGLR